MYAPWAYLNETTRSYENIVDHCTIYAIAYCGIDEKTGGITFANGGDAALGRYGTFTNNTVLADGTGKAVGGEVSAINYYDYYGISSQVSPDTGSGEGHYFDNNCYFAINGGNIALWTESDNSKTTVSTLTGLKLWWTTNSINTRSALNDEHSINIDPQFVDAANGDFNTVNMDLSLAGGDYIGAVAPTDANIVAGNIKRGVGVKVNGTVIDGTLTLPRKSRIFDAIK
jgi:hypothetical protein